MRLVRTPARRRGAVALLLGLAAGAASCGGDGWCRDQTCWTGQVTSVEWPYGFFGAEGYETCKVTALLTATEVAWPICADCDWQFEVTLSDRGCTHAPEDWRIGVDLDTLPEIVQGRPFAAGNAMRGTLDEVGRLDFTMSFAPYATWDEDAGTYEVYNGSYGHYLYTYGYVLLPPE